MAEQERERDHHPSFPPGMRYRARNRAWHAAAGGDRAGALCGARGKPIVVADPVVTCGRCRRLMRRARARDDGGDGDRTRPGGRGF